MTLEPRQLLSAIEHRLVSHPPEGLERGYVRSFLSRHRIQLLRLLRDRTTTRLSPPISLWWGRAGEAVSLELVEPGMRVVTPEGQHGEVLGIREWRRAGATRLEAAVTLDSGRTAVVPQLFFELVPPVRVEPDIFWAGTWMTPDDFLAEMGQRLEERARMAVALRSERTAEARQRLQARLEANRIDLALRYAEWERLPRTHHLEGGRLLEALIRLEVDDHLAGSQGLDWLRAENAPEGWDRLVVGDLVARPVRDAERVLAVKWGRVREIRVGELGWMEAGFAGGEWVPGWGVRKASKSVAIDSRQN